MSLSAGSEGSEPTAAAAATATAAVSSPLPFWFYVPDAPLLPVAWLSASAAECRPALLSLLQQIHPGLGLRSSALPPLERLLNALAYTLLCVADQSPSQQLQFRVPNEQVNELMHELCKHGETERMRQIADPPAPLLLPAGVSDRALDVYHSLHPSSTLRLHGTGGAELRGMLEYVMCEVLEPAGFKSKDRQAREICCEDVWAALQKDEELYVLCMYLRAPWGGGAADMQFTAQGEPTSDAAAVFGGITSIPDLHVLAESSAPLNAPLLCQMAARCWWHDAARVQSTMAAYANGTLPAGRSPSALLSARLSSMGITPLCWFGVKRGDVTEGDAAYSMGDDACDWLDDHGYWSDGDPKQEYLSWFAVQVDDPLGRPHIYLLRQNRGAGDAEPPVVQALLTLDARRILLANGPQFEPEKVSMPKGWLIPLLKFMHCLHHCQRQQQSAGEQLAASSAAAEEESGVGLSRVVSSALSSPCPTVEERWRVFQQPFNALSALPKESRRLSASHADVQVLQHAMAALWDLGEEKYWTPQLFSQMQPPRLRAQFTAARLQAAFDAIRAEGEPQQQQLPHLPKELLYLIGEYAPAMLPVLDDGENVIAPVTLAATGASPPVAAAAAAAASTPLTAHQIDQLRQQLLHTGPSAREESVDPRLTAQQAEGGDENRDEEE